MESCQKCRFWIMKDNQAVCRRFPTLVYKGPEDWCGEFTLPVPVQAELKQEPAKQFQRGRR